MGAKVPCVPSVSFDGGGPGHAPQARPHHRIRIGQCGSAPRLGRFDERLALCRGKTGLVPGH